MLTPKGPKVIEYNCRFGDPETQVVLPLLESDLFTIMKAVHDGTLADVDVTFGDGAACCVVCASDGYPGKYETGYPMTLPETTDTEAVYVAGAKIKDGTLVTGGGRVLGAVAVRDTLKEAIDAAYVVADGVKFDNKYMRRDIGARALAAKN